MSKCQIHPDIFRNYTRDISVKARNRLRINGSAATVIKNTSTLILIQDHNYTGDSRAELEFKALELHASRIFDDELWVDYLQFNQKYRTEVIDPTRLVLVMPDCCKKAGQLTWARFEENREYNCCPHCGRWTQIRLLEEG